MIALKRVAAAASVTIAMLVAAAGAEAATARQITSQGQGLFTTSNGLPQNFIGDAYPRQQSEAGMQDANRIRDFEHHNRYFGGY